MQLDKVYGSLLGLVLADAIGARFEGLSAEQLRTGYLDKFAAFDYSAGRDGLRYTDDGQMALVLAEYLCEPTALAAGLTEPTALAAGVSGNSTIDPNSLMQRFVEAYDSWRGYGRGARVLIEAFRDGADYEFMAEHLFPGGSLGNGAAMRSAPIGLRFVGDVMRIWQEAKQSAWPTHRHELGIEGAQLIALATSIATNSELITPSQLAQTLLPHCQTTVFQNRLERLDRLQDESEIETFGNGIEAHESVVTALACFALHPTDYRQAVATAIWQGGDTDTIAAMTGALVGAHVGSKWCTEMPLDRLEEGQQFIEYLHELAERFVKVRQNQ